MSNFSLMAVLVTVVFWNVENFFGDRPYFYAKCNGIAKTVMEMADKEGGMPDIIALAEVGDRKVLERLVFTTALRKFDYRIVHYDSPDKRGIDCALLYRKSSLRKIGSKPCHLYDSTGAVMNTRDILLCQFDSLTILVNHHPSKVGQGGNGRRRIAMDRMNALCDSLENEGVRKILCVGDFNDNLWGPFTQGTIKYNGEWEKIDGHFSRGLHVSEKVFVSPFLLTKDSKFGGQKPLRSFSGPRWLGGLSDHLPLILETKPYIHFPADKHSCVPPRRENTVGKGSALKKSVDFTDNNSNFAPEVRLKSKTQDNEHIQRF